MALMLGIDTGGTYTDAVIYDDAAPPPGILTKAKSPTTHHDLSIGIDGAISAVLGSGISAAEIALVSVSTTLATNALVENKGGRVALILIGFDQRAVTRAGLAEAMGDEPVVHVAGGHGPTGERQAPLDTEALRKAVHDHAGSVEAFAIVAHFGVRDPVDELAAAEVVRSACDLPITLGHHLSQGLNGPKRALTAVLNARLIGTISALIAACEDMIAARGISAPLMIVRGDGSLVSAEFARNRPIETILSGPAASLVGAAHLCDSPNAIVTDIGGTTTDIAILQDRRPRLSAEGATVGGFQTMVEAVAMTTHGLGGDSWVRVDDRAAKPQLTLGPRRVLPIAHLAARWPKIIHEALDAALARQTPAPEPLFITRVPRSVRSSHKPAEVALLDRLGDEPVPANTVLVNRQAHAAMQHLFDRGEIMLSAFTPTDAAHVLGQHDTWDRDAAVKAADIMARRKTARGDPIAPNGNGLAELVRAKIIRASAEVLLDAVLATDGLPANAAAGDLLIQSALDGHHGAARVSIGLDLPLIGLGASAALYYPDAAKMLGTDAKIPNDADVANAIGAVVGQVRLMREASITHPSDGIFRVHGAEAVSDHTSLSAAKTAASLSLRTATQAAAVLAGASEIETTEQWEERTAIVENQKMFIEGVLRVSATGRPRLAV